MCTNKIKRVYRRREAEHTRTSGCHFYFGDRIRHNTTYKHKHTHTHTNMHKAFEDIIGLPQPDKLIYSLVEKSGG